MNNCQKKLISLWPLDEKQDAPSTTSDASQQIFHQWSSNQWSPNRSAQLHPSKECSISKPINNNEFIQGVRKSAPLKHQANDWKRKTNSRKVDCASLDLFVTLIKLKAQWIRIRNVFKKPEEKHYKCTPKSRIWSVDSI